MNVGFNALMGLDLIKFGPDIYADLFDDELDGVADSLDAAIQAAALCGRPSRRNLLQTL
jgi:hypothetical protein